MSEALIVRVGQLVESSGDALGSIPPMFRGVARPLTSLLSETMAVLVELAGESVALREELDQLRSDYEHRRASDGEK